MSGRLAGVALGLERAADGGLVTALRRELRGLALEAEGQAKENATTRPRVRGGALRRSIVGTLEGEGLTLRIVLTAGGAGPAEPYAALQEYGGEVRPRNGRFLAIPVGPALTASGVARFRSARDVPGLRFIAIRGGAMGLLVKTTEGRRSRSTVYFVLVRRVKVPATEFIGRAITTAQENAGPRLSAVLGQVVRLGD